MNGVITDDEKYHEMSTKLAFGHVGLRITPERYRKFCLGRTDEAAFKDLIDEYQIKNVEIIDLITNKTELYMDLIKNKLPIYPGVVALIKSLFENFTLALTTSSTANEANTVIGKLMLENYFKAVVTAEDVTKGKPHPEPYLLTAEKLGVNCSECLVIEDSENGVRSAKAAGMFCIAVTNTEKPQNLHMADLIIDEYSEITVDIIRNGL